MVSKAIVGSEGIVHSNPLELKFSHISSNTGSTLHRCQYRPPDHKMCSDYLAGWAIPQIQSSQPGKHCTSITDKPALASVCDP